MTSNDINDMCSVEMTKSNLFMQYYKNNFGRNRLTIRLTIHATILPII